MTSSRVPSQGQAPTPSNAVADLRPPPPRINGKIKSETAPPASAPRGTSSPAALAYTDNWLGMCGCSVACHAGCGESMLCSTRCPGFEKPVVQRGEVTLAELLRTLVKGQKASSNTLDTLPFVSARRFG